VCMTHEQGLSGYAAGSVHTAVCKPVRNRRSRSHCCWDVAAAHAHATRRNVLSWVLKGFWGSCAHHVTSHRAMPAAAVCPGQRWEEAAELRRRALESHNYHAHSKTAQGIQSGTCCQGTWVLAGQVSCSTVPGVGESLTACRRQWEGNNGSRACCIDRFA
jgi:hypothetical protein